MADLSATRLMILARIGELDTEGKGVTKSEVTSGLPDRTQANWWRMISELWNDGYLVAVGQLVGPDRWRLNDKGKETVQQCFRSSV